MDVKEHYTTLLGLGDEWSVSDISLDLEHRKIDIFLRYLPPSAICPVCGRLATVRDQLEERTWRHLDTMQFLTLIHARTPRVDCPEHGAKVIELPWASKHSRFTLLFKAFAI
jgi:transposase